MNLNSLNRFLDPIRRQIFLLVGKAILTAVNNEGKVGFNDSGSRSNPQRLTMNWFGQLTDIERSQPYGFETNPVVDTAKAVLLSPDGSRSNAFVIMVQDDEYRPIDLVEGGVCLYDNEGGRHTISGGKHAIGNKDTGNELLDLVDKTLDEFIKLVDSSLLGGSNSVDLGGTASTGTMFKIAAGLATMKTDLEGIKTKLDTIKGNI